MHTRIRLLAGATTLLAGVSLQAQDLLGVTWGGATVLVNSYTGAVTPLGTGLLGQNGLGRDTGGVYFSTRTNQLGATQFSLTSIAPHTGSATTLYASVDLRALSVGPGAALYGIKQLAAGDQLVQIDMWNGAITPIGSTGFLEVEGLALHQGTLYAWDESAGLLILDQLTGAAIDPFPGIGGPAGLKTLCSHQDGRLLVGGGTSTNSLFSVDVTTGTTTLIGVMTGATDVRGLEPLAGFMAPFGVACNGVHGPASLWITGLPQVGGTLTATSLNHAPGSLGAVLFGLSTSVHQGQPLPLLLDPLLGTSSCRLYTSIDASVIVFTDGNTPAQLTYGFNLGLSAIGAMFHVQHACFEPVAGNLSFSNGVTVQVR